MIIYGAGMAGLLAANLLRRFKPIVYEAQESLPNNHSALLRFRTPDIGAACGVRFKEVDVSKSVFYEGKIFNESNVFLSNQYSQKVTDAILNRSIDSLQNSKRFIAPPNLVEMMAINCKINYNTTISNSEVGKFDITEPTISTLPMPVMMDLIGWERKPEFKFKPIWVQRATIKDPSIDVYQTIYYPDKQLTHYRASVIGDEVIVEHSEEPLVAPGPTIMSILREDFGIDAMKLDDLKSSTQKFGKILPIDENLRKEFVLKLTKDYNIYSLGRFATWRQVLLDDLVKDIDVIEKFVSGNHSYNYEIERVDI